MGMIWRHALGSNWGLQRGKICPHVAIETWLLLMMHAQVVLMRWISHLMRIPLLLWRHHVVVILLSELWRHWLLDRRHNGVVGAVAWRRSDRVVVVERRWNTVAHRGYLLLGRPRLTAVTNLFANQMVDAEVSAVARRLLLWCHDNGRLLRRQISGWNDLRVETGGMRVGCHWCHESRWGVGVVVVRGSVIFDEGAVRVVMGRGCHVGTKKSCWYSPKYLEINDKLFILALLDV